MRGLGLKLVQVGRRLFISSPVGVEPGALREGMTLELRWADGTDRFGDYQLPVFGPSSTGG